MFYVYFKSPENFRKLPYLARIKEKNKMQGKGSNISLNLTQPKQINPMPEYHAIQK